MPTSIGAFLRRAARSYVALAVVVFVLLSGAAAAFAAPGFFHGGDDRTPVARGTGPQGSGSYLASPSASGGSSANGSGHSGASLADVRSTEDVGFEENNSSSRARNVVIVQNRTDGRLRMRGSIQLNRITSSNASPLNMARAYSSCTDCSTLAIAMQLNLISRSTHVASPQNYAVAINYKCTRCHTIAFALQYTFSVDDPRAVPSDVQRLIREMDRELNAIARDRQITLEQAIARINDVIARFSQLATSLQQQRDEETSSNTPGATNETPAPSPSWTPAPQPAVTPVPTQTPSPTASPSTAAPSPT